MSQNLPQTEIILEVPFHDVDSISVVWHGHYVKYFELARCHLLDMIDYNYPAMMKSGFAWPVVDMRIRYERPARFRQRLRIRATMTESDPKIVIRFLITDADSGERLTRGQTSQVAVDMATGEMMMVAPPVLAERLAEWNSCKQTDDA